MHFCIMHISWWHPASKNLLRLEAGYPALRCHILEEGHPIDLKKYRRGLVSSELLSETEILFCSRQKASNQKAAELTFLLETKGQQPESSRAACGQGGRAARGARAAGSVGRGAAPAQPPAAGDGSAARGAPAAVR